MIPVFARSRTVLRIVGVPGTFCCGSGEVSRPSALSASRRTRVRKLHFSNTRASVFRTNVYAGPNRPFLRGFSNNEENQVVLRAGATANGDTSVERGSQKAILQADGKRGQTAKGVIHWGKNSATPPTALARHPVMNPWESQPRPSPINANFTSD
jgi:protein involved in temperature-dependent protein secretion